MIINNAARHRVMAMRARCAMMSETKRAITAGGGMAYINRKSLLAEERKTRLGANYTHGKQH